MPATLAADQRFIVDRRLGAVRVDQLLDVRAQLRLEGRIDRPVPPGADRALLTGGQSLAADVVYPAERAQTLRFYLPKYQIAAENGKPMVELRVEPAGGTAFGTLSITLTWTSPAVAANLQLRAIDHQLTLAVRSSVPVENKATPGIAAAPTPGTTGFEHRLVLLPPVAIDGQRVRSVTPIPDRALFNSLYQAMRSPNQQATLELQISARVGVKTWNQVLVGRPAGIDAVKVDRRNNGAVFTEMSRAEQLAMPAPQVTTRLHIAEPVMAVPLASSAMRMQAAARPLAAEIAFEPTDLRVAAPQVLTQPRIADTAVLRPPVQARIADDATFARIETPALRRVIDESDFRIDGQRVVPTRVALDEQMRPAVIDAAMQCQQTLPFYFDPAQPANVGVYVAEGYTPSIHMLLPLTLNTGSGVITVYQDNLMLDVVHVTPTEFRLQREANAPHLPNLSFVASDFRTDATDAGAAVVFRVSMVYKLEPWLDPKVFQLASAALPKQQLRFTTTIPPDAKLTVDLPSGALVRDKARIDATGVDDVLELDYKVFEQLWLQRLAPVGVEIGGRVEYKLFDGTPAQVPVRMSLHDDSADLFDVAAVSPPADPPKRLRVQVRNRIESPVEIVKLMGGGARLVDPDAALGKVLKPQEKLLVDYESDSAPASDEPSVIGRPRTDLEALLRVLMVTVGYASLGFKVTLQASAESFAAAAANGEAITGLLVEFDDDTCVTLTPQELQKEVSLFARIVDRLLGRGENSQHYLYRVTNVHASGTAGARSDWVRGEGSGALAITAVQSGLGF